MARTAVDDLAAGSSSGFWFADSEPLVTVTSACCFHSIRSSRRCGVLTTAPDEVRELLTHWTEGSSLVVVALCAAWCDTRNEFRTSFERIAERRPDIVFVWLDIEDDSDVCGDIDVENFPTLAIYRGDALLHFGVSLPQQSTVARLVDEMTNRTASGSAAPDAVVKLPRTLRRRFAHASRKSDAQIFSGEEG